MNSKFYIDNKSVLLNTPQERLQAYDKGLIGAILDHEDSPLAVRRLAQYERDQFNDVCEVKNFGDVFAGRAGISKGKIFFSWQFYNKYAPGKAMKGAQATGDCVSWAKRTSTECTRTCESELDDAIDGPFEYIDHGATALVYRSRGHSSQGMSGDQAAKCVKENGVLFERKYLDGKYDFTEYKTYIKWAMQGNKSIPEDLLAETRKQRLLNYARIKSADELADSIASGHPPDCCSGIACTSSSDEKGLSVLRGSWSHDMAIVGVDDSKEIWPFRVFIWDQSWGKWNKQVTPPLYQRIAQQLGIEMPEGYFILSEDHTMKAVKQDGTICCSQSSGFPISRLTDLGATGHV